MKSTAKQVIKRIESAFERATRGSAAFVWQLERVELTLQVEAGRGISRGLVTLVRRESESEVIVLDDQVVSERVRVPLSAPFRSSSNQRDARRTRHLVETLEVAFGLFNAMGQGEGMGSMTHGELQWFFVVDVSGEVLLVPSDHQDSYEDVLHELKMYFAKSDQRLPSDIAVEVKESEIKGATLSDAMIVPPRI